jgi:mannose-6-phosphate isomerase class I
VAGWTGDYFPLLTKFIDASGALPVHLHADDEAAQRLEGQPNGKTEAWHILEAAPGATALCGAKEGVTLEQLRKALLEQDFDRVLRRLPVRAGETIYVPGGTLHSFGPDTLVYEIEQTSDISQHAMHWNMEDGSDVPEEEFQANIATLLEEVALAPRPDFTPGLRIRLADGVERVVLCAGPYFALERWSVGTAAPLRHAFGTAMILSNVGAPVQVRWRAQRAARTRRDLASPGSTRDRGAGRTGRRGGGLPPRPRAGRRPSPAVGGLLPGPGRRPRGGAGGRGPNRRGGSCLTCPSG